jgi:hypothetical protein
MLSRHRKCSRKAENAGRNREEAYEAAAGGGAVKASSTVKTS